VNNIESYLKEMIEEGLKFQLIGDIQRLPEKSQTILSSIVDRTKDNTGIVLTLALIY
jgi:undecaprenyl diphosphate synthase